ncbi:NAD(P)H-binding protein [Sansalvadorimonas verongulae]|uniref:NAD(P)H-binding protein n=1 Tax=Sansalvadorimonas verongulae TaxID=2172824 RepID=UPI0012BD5A8E|nr:NAD(P)H-binding protein [Sansalvadorimonas verongulae]MTI12845.1 hypothetical protein [Sansalvadorimonas verongulae]
MKRVSILGCGRVGMTLGKELAQAGYAVKGSTTCHERFHQLQLLGIEPVKLTFTPKPEGELDNLLDADALVVCLTPPGRDSGYTYNDQLSAISKAAKKAGIKQVILTGATFIYPLSNNEVTEEDVDSQKSAFMGLDWLDAENALRSANPEAVTILRLAGLMGEGHNAAAYFSGRPMAGADAPVNMIHQEDVAGVIRQLIEQDVCGEVFNLCAPLHPSRREFYTLASEKAGIPAPQFTDEPKPYRIVNCDKLQAKLDYTFRHPDPLKAL